MIDPAFWSRQRVLLTGHTGFKGSWASLWLERLGATVVGYALAPDQTPNLFSMLAPFERAHSTIADLADRDALRALVAEFQPTLVLHMAAQPLVRRAFADPAGTFETNVQGTVNLLEALRPVPGIKAVLVVTTDKVYEDAGDSRAFLEQDRLGGSDPYSASKAATEIAVSSYAKSFLEPAGVPLATARAGNVIGGGDWSEDRLIPDIWRALHAGEPIALRYPRATRPWQHVLESLSGYLTYLQHLATTPEGLPRALNFGPAGDRPPVTVAEIVELLQRELKCDHGWKQATGDFPPETSSLALDSGNAAAALGWWPRLSSDETIGWTAEWYRRFDSGDDPRALTLHQIAAYGARL